MRIPSNNTTTYQGYSCSFLQSTQAITLNNRSVNTKSCYTKWLVWLAHQFLRAHPVTLDRWRHERSSILFKLETENERRQRIIKGKWTVFSVRTVNARVNTVFVVAQTPHLRQHQIRYRQRGLLFVGGPTQKRRKPICLQTVWTKVVGVVSVFLIHSESLCVWVQLSESTIGRLEWIGLIIRIMLSITCTSTQAMDKCFRFWSISVSACFRRSTLYYSIHHVVFFWKGISPGWKSSSTTLFAILGVPPIWSTTSFRVWLTRWSSSLWYRKRSGRSCDPWIVETMKRWWHVLLRSKWTIRWRSSKVTSSSW